MAYSRITRVEEKRTKKQLYIVVGGIIVLILLIIIFGIPLLVRISQFISPKDSNSGVEDTTPPFSPVISPVQSATNSAILKIEGYAEPEATLTLYVNGDEVKKNLLGKEGTFSFSDIELNEGNNTLYALATDASGNESNPSPEFIITYKKSGPKLEIQEPQDGQAYGKNQQTAMVKGLTDAGSQIWINSRYVSVRDDGSFDYALRLNEGDNAITIISRDSAGNETKVERIVRFSPQ